jgi:RNA polymerase sigma-70 factor (ECF subfamily)
MDAPTIIGPGKEPGPLDALVPTPTSAEQVYYDYAPRVFQVARQMVRTDADAEDVTQDVLLQVVRKLPSFRGASAFPTWLHRVTVNTALTHRRRHSVRQGSHRHLSLENLAVNEGPARGWSATPEAQLVDHETRHLIDRAVARLPEKYRTIFVLAEMEGLPNATIAQRLGMSLAAVKSRLHRARAMLRQALAPYFEETSTAAPAGCFA